MNTNVTLYVESGSATSDQTKTAMDSAGIAYELVSVTASEYPLQAVGTSYPTAPVTVVDGTSWDGYRPDLIARLATEQALEAYRARGLGSLRVCDVCPSAERIDRTDDQGLDRRFSDRARRHPARHEAFHLT